MQLFPEPTFLESHLYPQSIRKTQIETIIQLARSCRRRCVAALAATTALYSLLPASSLMTSFTCNHSCQQLLGDAPTLCDPAY